MSLELLHISGSGIFDQNVAARISNTVMLLPYGLLCLITLFWLIFFSGIYCLILFLSDLEFALFYGDIIHML